MKLFLGMNSLIVVSLVFSGVFLAIPSVSGFLKGMEAEAVLDNFRKIEFSLNLFFYTEGFEMISPAKVNISVLVNRYYLRKNPGGDYGIIWLDHDIKDDGKIVAAVFYKGSVDPVFVKRKESRLKWVRLKDGTVSADYSPDRYPSLVVEVIKSW